MSSTHWERMKEIFGHAAELPPERRPEYLREVCADDALLREEVESLLQAAETPTPVLDSERYGLASILDGNGSSYEGKAFGHYKVIREIGRGGMGTVFLAERADGEFQQKVALKIVRLSLPDSELARRFRQERQILATLNHPTIARLLDGGVSADGDPFLVMEYVDGVPIDQFCTKHSLSISERLELFLSVCQGIFYAHQHLVVHRDLKPSNILVTEEGLTKLLDFGIAKLLDANDSDAQTQTQFHAFTPQYASPEQIRGERITTASDVYSLGVLLQQLLDGKPPVPAIEFPSARYKASQTFNGETMAIPAMSQTGRKRNTAATQPHNLPPELRNIIARAKSAEPARRYTSVEQLAADISRYLSGRPVLAQKDSLAYRTRKFVLRNKIAVGAAALVVVSLISGLALALWQANVAHAQRARAEKRFGDVRRLSNVLLTDIAPKVERLQGSTEVRETIVNQSLNYLDSLAQESSDDLSLQGELATAYEQVGSLQGNPRKPNLRDFTGAVSSYHKAQVIREQLLRQQPDNLENRRRLAQNYHEMSRIHFAMNDFDGALKGGNAAINFYQEIISRYPSDTSIQLALAEAQVDLAYAYYYNNHLTESYPLLQQAELTLEKPRVSDAANHDLLRLLGRIYTQRSLTFSWDGRQREGEVEMNKALAILEPLAMSNANDVLVQQDLLRTYTEASSLYEEINDPLSLQYLTKALALAETAVRQDPLNLQAQHTLGTTYSRLGVLSLRLHRPETLSYLQNAYQILIRLEKNEPSTLAYKIDLARIATYQGQTKFQLGKYLEALDDYQNAVTLFESVVKADSESKTALRHLAVTHRYMGEANYALAKTGNRIQRQSYRHQAKGEFHESLNILLQLKSQNALTSYDEKMIDQMETAVKLFERY